METAILLFPFVMFGFLACMGFWTLATHRAVKREMVAEFGSAGLKALGRNSLGQECFYDLSSGRIVTRR